MVSFHWTCRPWDLSPPSGNSMSMNMNTCQPRSAIPFYSQMSDIANVTLYEYEKYLIESHTTVFMQITLPSS